MTPDARDNAREVAMKEYRKDYFITAGQCDAQQQIPLTVTTRRVIEVATLHANALGVGYDRLIKDDAAWVLTRLVIEMASYPGINSDYSLTTWIEDTNRRFSERDFVFADAEGHPLGYVRSTWMAINIKTRQAASLDGLDALADNVSDRPCPIARATRLPAVTAPDRTSAYRFRYCDIDFNRHVNTVRYIELLLDQWTMEWHDRYAIERFEIAFMHETRYDADVTVAIAAEEPLTFIAEISTADACSCRARVKFRPRDGKIVAN